MTCRQASKKLYFVKKIGKKLCKKKDKEALLYFIFTCHFVISRFQIWFWYILFSYKSMTSIATLNFYTIFAYKHDVGVFLSPPPLQIPTYAGGTEILSDLPIKSFLKKISKNTAG